MRDSVRDGVTGAEPIESYFQVRSARAPSFSADGTTIAFLSDATGRAQVWLLEPDAPDAPPRQATFHDDAVSQVVFAPAGHDLIYLMDRGGDERHQIYLLPDGGGAPRALTARADAIHSWGGWSSDATAIAYTTNDRDPACMDAVVMHLADGTARRVLETAGWYTVEGISPSLRHLLLLETRGSSDQSLHLLEISTGRIMPLTPQAQRSRYQCCRWRRDGRSFYCVSNRGREFLAIARFDLDGGDMTFLHGPEHDVEEIALSKCETRLAAVTNVEGYGRLSLHDLASGAVQEAPGLPPGTITGLTWAPDGTRLAFTLDGSRHNPEIWLWDLDAGRVRQLTRSDRAGLDGTAWVEPRLVSYSTFDGRDIPAFLYRPRDAAPEPGAPAVIVVHGGPEMQHLPSFHPEIQALLARGYAVLAPNVRGSSGYGATYCALDDVHRRMDSVRDLQHARLWLGDRPEIDAERIAVFGRSYGGFMVLAAITEYPDLWKAAVEFYGIANFESFFERTGPWRRRHRAMEYGDPIKDADFLRSISPIHKVTQIRVPLFVAQGLSDPRVPPYESELIVAALRRRDLPVDYVAVPGEGHGFTRQENRIRVFGAMVGFLERYL